MVSSSGSVSYSSSRFQLSGVVSSSSSLGSSYTTDYLRVYIYTYNDGDKDWNKTYNFLLSDCGRDFDCYLYLNGDNKAGGFWHEYIFK